VRLLLLVTLFACAIAAATLTAATDDDQPRPILISRQLAQTEGLHVGQMVRLSRNADGSEARRYRIDGIFEPTPDPMRLGAVLRKVRMHLPDLLDLLREPGQPAGSEHIDGINVRLADGVNPLDFSRDVSARMPGLFAQPSSQAAGSTGPFVVLERFHLAIAIVTIFAATVFLLALTIMLVDERRATVGILRLIGLPSSRILVQLFIEGVLIAGLGAVFGILLALGSQHFINQFFQWRYDTALIFVRITPRVAAICTAIAVPLGVCATVAASWALLRRNGLSLARR
jgi:ABC-type lipoprotein release transport system permease subunit